MTLADSDVLIDYLRGAEPGAARVEAELRTGRLSTTVINAFELLSGARSERDRDKVGTLLAAVLVLPLDGTAADMAAAVRRELEARGEGIGTADYLIAGVALTQDAVLLTRNRRHFARVPGLKLGVPGED